MSTTAFPMLARILVEPEDARASPRCAALTCGAVDDAAGWFLIALAATIAVAGSVGAVARTVGEAIAFCLLMVFLVRPLLRRVSDAFDQSGRVPPGWVALIFAGVLLSAYGTEIIGIAAIVGGFLMGMVMPRNADLTEDVTLRVEDFTVNLLLPLFFAYIGLQMNIGSAQPTGAVADHAGADRRGDRRQAGRGGDRRSPGRAGLALLRVDRHADECARADELIVLNVALQEGVISNVLFTMMVLVSLITTFMAGPLVRLLDPRHELSAPVEEELVVSGSDRWLPSRR